MGILAVLLGLVAIVCALFGTFLFGTTGAIIAGVLAIMAIVLAVVKRSTSGKGGIFAIVASVLAVILAISMNGFVSELFVNMHKKAAELKPDGLWAQISMETNGGLIGVAKSLPQDEATLNQLVDEMNQLSQMNETQK